MTIPPPHARNATSIMHPTRTRSRSGSAFSSGTRAFCPSVYPVCSRLPDNGGGPKGGKMLKGRLCSDCERMATGYHTVVNEARFQNALVQTSHSWHTRGARPPLTGQIPVRDSLTDGWTCAGSRRTNLSSRHPLPRVDTRMGVFSGVQLDIPRLGSDVRRPVCVLCV